MSAFLFSQENGRSFTVGLFGGLLKVSTLKCLAMLRVKHRFCSVLKVAGLTLDTAYFKLSRVQDQRETSHPDASSLITPHISLFLNVFRGTHRTFTGL